jgi:hypothetical protein
MSVSPFRSRFGFPLLDEFPIQLYLALRVVGSNDQPTAVADAASTLLPTLPVDETTGQHAKNPWSDPPDLTSQMEVEQRDPKRSAHLKAVKDGVSYSFLIKQRDKREASAKIRELPYSKKELRNNAFLIPLKEGGLKMQSAFRICVSCYAEMQDDIHRRSECDRQSEQDGLRMRSRSDDDNLKATERKAILSN